MVESWDACKSKGREKKKEDEGGAPEAGCWVRLRFILGAAFLQDPRLIPQSVTLAPALIMVNSSLFYSYFMLLFIYLFLYTSIGFLKLTLNIFLVIKGSYAWNDVKVENINAV